MKGGALILLLIFIPNVNAAWEEYQNDNLNTGRADGVGNLNKFLSNITDSDDGFAFQPLVSDINDDNKNEIIIFSNESLKVLDNKLNEIDKTLVGILQGQPVIFNIDDDAFKEIIFISNHSLSPYFFAYEYSNFTFRQEFNFSIANGAIGSGVKCAELGSTKVCVFMDNGQYIHIVNLSSRTDQYYNTSVFNDTQKKIPAIGDIDNDGNLEAVFWFDANSNINYGLLAFDLLNGSLDAGFSNDGVVDDIAPLNVVRPRFDLKGHPVLVDLNNDNKMEIAVSMFYDDGVIGEAFDDWYTQLFVYGSDGTLLFNKCGERFDNPENCNDGAASSFSMWEGTNPFVLDSNNDDIDDICFIKDKKLFTDFKNMTINCYNYSGSKLLDAELFPAVGTVKTAIAADMDNDGYKDIVTDRGIYALNGSSIFRYDSEPNIFAIPADIDGNSGLDLILSNENRIIAFLDNTTYNFDFSIKTNDILFEKNKTKIILHNNGDGFIENLEILALNTETMQNQTITTDIRANSNMTIYSNLTLNKKESLLVQLDYNNKIDEIDEKNNFAFKKFDGFPFVFINIDLGINNLENEFVDYIKDNLKSSYFTNNENEASIKIYIGKNNIFNKQKSAFTRFNFDYYYDFGNIYYKDKIGSLPYNGLVSAFNENYTINGNNIINNENNVINILIYGNEIDGIIAAVKEFINKEADFININDEKSFFIDDENLNAVNIFDFLHNTGNENNYLLDNNAFKNIVRNALRDEMFVEKDYTVNSASGVNLRLRNLKPNASNMYLLYLNSSGVPVELPVVLAHGLFSNLSTWQVLASEISNTGRDTWLIEITGGPGQDCEDCLDYTFYNLTDDFVPTLLNEVLDLTDKDKIQYVGFSNGCRAALDSLERNKFDSSKVETFVAVGCPGAFDHSKDTDSASPISKVLNNNGNSAIKSFRGKNIKHISFSDLAKEIVDIERFFDDKTKISVNLFQQYYNWSADNSDNEPGEGISINNFFAIQGNLFTYSDGVVSTYDINKTYHNINSNKKKYINIPSSHLGLDDSARTKVFIRKLVNNETFTTFENLVYVIISEP